MRDFIATTTFLIYTILYEGMVWLGGMYVILNYEWSAWWIVFLCLLSGAQIKPRHWRFLLTREKKPECNKIIIP